MMTAYRLRYACAERSLQRHLPYARVCIYKHIACDMPAPSAVASATSAIRASVHKKKLPAGLEPATPSLRMKCTTDCATEAVKIKKAPEDRSSYDQSGNRTRVSAVRGRRLSRLTNWPVLKVEATRLELAASASRTRRSTKLSHASTRIVV